MVATNINYFQLIKRKLELDQKERIVSLLIKGTIEHVFV